MNTAQYSDYIQHWQPTETRIINGLPVRFSDICVHEFTVGDVEDPVLYAGAPLLDWQSSAAGVWVIAHAEEQPYWVKDLGINTYQHRFRIIARLSEQNYTFFKLKWGI